MYVHFNIVIDMNHLISTKTIWLIDKDIVRRNDILN